MQSRSMEALVQLILDVLDKRNRKILFLITASSQDENIILRELYRLLDRYPDSKICMDSVAEGEGSVIQNDTRCKEKLLSSRKDIRQEVSLADDIAAVSLDLSTLRKVSMGLEDSNVTFACMEALLSGKRIVAADDDCSRLIHSNETYRRIFEEAKDRMETYGVIFGSLHQLHSILEMDNRQIKDGKKIIHRQDGGKKQIVTVEELANNQNLVIDDDAIITPAARELLVKKKMLKAEE